MFTQLQFFQNFFPHTTSCPCTDFSSSYTCFLICFFICTFLRGIAFDFSFALKAPGDLDTSQRLCIWHYWLLCHMLVCVLQAVIRVRFPDNYILEATFHPSETIQSLLDLLVKVIAHPELPFYICKSILNICYILLFPIFYPQEQFIIIVLLKI